MASRVRSLAERAAKEATRRALRPGGGGRFDDALRAAALALAARRREKGPRASSRILDDLYRRDGGHRPLLLGHRGAMARAPENTLGAFAAALDDGADGVELDTQLSADAIPIVLHDDTLDRTTDAEGLPLRHEAAELDHVDAGSWFAGWGREKVPRLTEVLELLAAAAAAAVRVVNVEIKGPTPTSLGLERRVVDVLRACPPGVQPIVSSFHPAQLLAVRALLPDVPIGLLIADDSLLPLRTGWAAALLLPDALHPPSSITDGALVAGAHRAGMRVHVWGVRDDADAARLLDLGVDGLIVDDVRATAALYRGRYGAPAVSSSSSSNSS